MVKIAQSLAALGVACLCWGCTAQGPAQAEVRTVVSRPREPTLVGATSANEYRSDHLGSDVGRYGAVRPRLSHVLSLGDVSFNGPEAPPLVSADSAPATKVVVVNNIVSGPAHRGAYRSPQAWAELRRSSGHQAHSQHNHTVHSPAAAPRVVSQAPAPRARQLGDVARPVPVFP